MKLRVAGVVSDSITDGPGMRLTVFAQGCPHRCEGCHNPQSHSFDGGEDVDTEELVAKAQKNPLCAGVTLSGGEPFSQAEAMADLARRVHATGKNVWVYTGYTLDQLLSELGGHPGWEDLLREADVLVDGPFVLAQRSLNLLFRGSRNQRILERAGDGLAFTERKD